MKAHFANARPLNRILAGELCLSELVRQHEGCREGEHGASSSFQREVTIVGNSFSFGNPRCPRGSRRRGVEPRCTPGRPPTRVISAKRRRLAQRTGDQAHASAIISLQPAGFSFPDGTCRRT